MRSVAVLSVASPEIWTELEAQVDLAAHIESVLDPWRRVVRHSFNTEVLPKLQQQVLIRYARRDRASEEESRAGLEAKVSALSRTAQRVLHQAQRHAINHEVFGVHAWDPQHDGPDVRALLSAELLFALPGEAAPYSGRYALNPDLPPPPEVTYDFTEAAMDETSDLPDGTRGPGQLLHDIASLAAAVLHVSPQKTHQHTLNKGDAKKLAHRLGAPQLALTADLEGDARWGRALRGLEALGVVSTGPLSRRLELDLGLETTLTGDTVEAMDRFLHRVLDRDLHVVLPALRQALHDAGEGAVDEMIFLEELYEQHRDVFFPVWQRSMGRIYPAAEGERVRAYDEDGWERVERRMVQRALSRAELLGLIRRADGVFAGTSDGRRWARCHALRRAPVWVTSDLELMVPPHSITPWERFQIERLCRCLGRDTVDRYRLEREGLVQWLSTHELPEALDVLNRRAPAVPLNVVETLTAWATSAQRIVLTRGVVVPS